MTSQNLERVVQQFELAWLNQGHAEIDDVLDQEYPEGEEILVELIRSDLEFRWEQETARSIEHYFERYPGLRNNDVAIKSIAFEEYRLRFNRGEDVEPEEYSQRFGINTTDWPTWNRRNNNDYQGSRGRFATAADSIIRMPEIGDCFGEFEIAGELGRGAAGCVYLARQGDLANRFVVLKITRDFSSEPQYLAELQHTNIVPIYSLHEIGECQVICMPFLGVATLGDLLRHVQDDPLAPRSGRALISTVAAKRASTIAETINRSEPRFLEQLATRNNERDSRLAAFHDFGYERTALWFVSQIASGLSFAHQHGIVHGDLKPGNILISDDGNPLLLDFHLSRFSKESTSDLQQIGGTLPYMSPEHLRALDADGETDERSDIYSLGIILFELLTGRLPFDISENGGGLDALLRSTIAERESHTPQLSNGELKFSPDVESIVERCLQPKPQNRYRTVNELRTDLNRHLEHLPLRFAANRSFRERARKWVKRHPRIASLTTLGTAAAIMLVFVSFLLVSRMNQVKRMKASRESEQAVQQIDVAKLPFTFDRGSKHLDVSIRNAESLISNYDQRRSEFAQTNKRLQLVSPDEKDKELRATSQLGFWVSRALLEKSKLVPTIDEKDALLEKARNVNEIARQIFPDARLPRALQLQQADILKRSGEYDLSASVEDDTPQTYMEGALDKMLSGSHLMQRGDYEAGLALLKEAATYDPLDYSIWVMMGNAHSQLGQNHEAIACYSVCVSLDPHASGAFYVRGLANLELKNFQAAYDDFTRVEQLEEPDDPATFFSRYLALRGLGRLQEAESDLTQCIELGTDQTRTYFVRAKLRRRRGNQAGANADVEMGLKLLPSDELSWISRGLAQVGTDPKLALSDFQKALVLNPDSKEALQNSAAIYSEFLNQPENAIEPMTRIIELYPNDVVAIATRGVLYGRLGDRDKALADASQALKKKKDADTFYRVAGIFALTSKIKETDAEKAVELLARAIWLNPELVSQSLREDPDIKPIQGHVRFREIVNILRSLQPRK